MTLAQLVADFGIGLKAADSLRPQAVNRRSKKAFQPGIGPHTEAQTVELVGERLVELFPDRYAGVWIESVPYPDEKRQRCDLCLGEPDDWKWAIEVKMIRFLGDNGKANDNILMHVLSPYPSHRSALTDCTKLVESGIARREALLVYGYEHDDWPLEPAIRALELLAADRVSLGPRHTADFSGLLHPVHQRGRVYAWELTTAS